MSTVFSEKTLETGNEVSPEEQLKRVADVFLSKQEWKSSPEISLSRSVLKLSPDDITNNLTATTLAQINGLHPPFVFTNDSKGQLHAFYYLGTQLAGHRGMLHGGLAAVLLDECMGRACFPLLPNRIAVTANLDISYRAPTLLPGIILVVAETEKVVGRKAWIRGVISEAETGKVLVEGKALMIEPRDASSMAKVM